MVSRLREDWLQDPKLRQWNSKSCTENRGTCRCGNDKNHVELWEQYSCVRGRIDSVVCTSCNTLLTFKIIR